MDWKNVVKQAAPMLGSALPLPPPLGLLAGKLIGALVGAKPREDGSFDDASLAEAFARNPEAVLKLKEAELEFQAKMKELDIRSVQDLEALAVQDRKSARERESTVRDKTPQIGFYFTTVGFFGLLTTLIFFTPPAGSRDLLNIMLGALALAWGNQVKYYYGGGKDDDRVNEMLHNSVPGGHT